MTTSPEPAPKSLTVAGLREAIKALPDEAVIVVDRGQTILHPVKASTTFSGKAAGDAYRLHAGGDVSLVILTI